MSRPRGELALVLHTHMPYVEGFGTWPFGEEWLWEAIASSYLPLLDLLEEGAPLTLSVTPVLADQLEAPGAMERCGRFVGETRRWTHSEALADAKPGERAALEHSARHYARAAERLAGLGGDLLGALAPHVAWTSSATHAVLPLVATTPGVRLQVQTGIASHRRRFGDWAGGFWLPECAHAPWLDPLLEDAGVRSTCVDLTDVFGLGAPEHLQPLRSPAGPVLAPLDRQAIELVWSPAGYPADGAYRDYHRHARHDHRAWANDGAVYDPERALAVARAHAADFVARVAARVAGGGLCVWAVDTELLGHWWHEGPQWLRFVLQAAERAGLPVVGLDDALERSEPVDAPADLPVTTWGTPRDLWTWSGPQAAEFAWRARSAEQRAVAGARAAGVGAARELLALQASDWAFISTRGLAGDYPDRRAEGHLERLLARLDGDRPDDDAALRNLAPDARIEPLLGP